MSYESDYDEFEDKNRNQEDEVRPVEGKITVDDENMPEGNNNVGGRSCLWGYISGLALIGLTIWAVTLYRSRRNLRDDFNNLKDKYEKIEKAAEDLKAEKDGLQVWSDGLDGELRDTRDILALTRDSLTQVRDTLALTRDSLANCRKAKKPAPRARKKATPKAQQKPATRPVAQPAPKPVVQPQPAPRDTVYVPRYNQPVVVDQMPAPATNHGQTVVNVNSGAQNTTVNVNNGTVNNYYGIAPRNDKVSIADTIARQQTSRCVIKTRVLSERRRSR